MRSQPGWLPRWLPRWLPLLMLAGALRPADATRKGAKGTNKPPAPPMAPPPPPASPDDEKAASGHFRAAVAAFQAAATSKQPAEAAGQWQRAETEFGAALGRNPKHPTAASNLVALLVNRGRSEEAVEVGMAAAGAGGPANMPLHKAIGAAFRGMKRHDEVRAVREQGEGGVGAG